MGQRFHVVRCFSCETFQVQQEFGQGSGADCRRHVQKLNAARGAKMEAQDNARRAKMEAPDDGRGAKMEAPDDGRGANMEAPDDGRGAKMEAQHGALLAKMETISQSPGSFLGKTVLEETSCRRKQTDFNDVEQLQHKPMSRWDKYLSSPQEAGLEEEEAGLEQAEAVMMDRDYLSLKKHKFQTFRPKTHQDQQDQSRPHSGLTSGSVSKWNEFLKSPDPSGPHSGLCGSSLFQTDEDFSLDLD